MRIELSRNCEIPLKRQIYQSLRELIEGGRIKSGEALPSTREFAKELGVSRNTVCEAYEMLFSEGYVTSHQGSATRVAEGVNLDWSLKTNSTVKTSLHNESQIQMNFQTGQPDLRYFPHLQWSQLLRKAYEDIPLGEFGYSGPEGLPRLREEIASWLFRNKGLVVFSDDIFITAGATHALHLMPELLCQGGKGIIIEDPCHMGMLRVLQNKKYPIYPIPVDDQGIQTDKLKKYNAGAIYVTPSHQFPLGGILPANRRVSLIRYARENDIYIIEDDYDSEFRYCGEPIAPLYSMNPAQVIYVGTFSKILFPALRIGYIILPRALQNQWKYLRTYADVKNPPFEQAALAEYLHSRKLDRYVQKMRRLYGERRKILLSLLKDTFGIDWCPWGDSAGLHIALEFPGIVFDNEFMRKSRLLGVQFTSVDYHSICKGIHLDKILLGYGHLEPDEIYKGVMLLERIIKNR